jgi:diacylglycerol kinase (ATP)
MKKIHDKKSRSINTRLIRAKLIFNAESGKPEESPQLLAEILNEMQSQYILPEVYMVRPDSRLKDVVRSAIKEGIKLVVVAGGDGTIDSVVGALVHSSATLGIIPTGTRNNVAYNLGIPVAVADAVALLRKGRRLKIDVGYIRSSRTGHWFLEAAELGLLSDLYPAADEFQHGDLAQIGTLLSKFVSSTPSHLRVIFEKRKRLNTDAYMVLITNMPSLGPHFKISPNVACNDSHLDMFVFSDMSKMDLISYAIQSTSGAVRDAHIKHYRVKQLTIHSKPQMPVLADGILLDPGSVTALVHSRALKVIVGATDAAMRRRTTASTVIDLKNVSHG